MCVAARGASLQPGATEPGRNVIGTAPVVASGRWLHTVVHSCLNAEGLDDLAVVVQLSPLSGEIWQRQESLHLHVHLQPCSMSHQCVISAKKL